MDEKVRDELKQVITDRRDRVIARRDFLKDAIENVCDAIDFMVMEVGGLGDGVALYTLPDHSLCLGQTDGTTPSEPPIFVVKVEVDEEDDGILKLAMTVRTEEDGELVDKLYSDITEMIGDLAEPLLEAREYLVEAEAELPDAVQVEGAKNLPLVGAAAPPDQHAHLTFQAKVLLNGVEDTVTVTALHAQEASDKLKDQGYEVLDVTNVNPDS